MVRVHQGTEPSVALSPHAAGRDLLSARGQLQEMGCGGAAATATSGQPWGIPLCRGLQGLVLGKEGSWDQVFCLDNLTSPPRSSLLALELMKWHQTSPRSAPQPGEQWVTGKSFSFKRCFWRYSHPRIEFRHKIGLLSEGMEQQPSHWPINHGS